ncbi:MAG: Ig-like domain-containing protein [Cyclobacteriaceae bacterium]
MKSSVLILLIGLVVLDANAQNRKPKIVGQSALSTNEDQSVTIMMNHLEVEDPDDWFYPWGFTMKVYPGSDYSVSGDVVTPDKNFSGKLKVPVSVHDGDDESNKYDFQITVNPVNDKPLITGHDALTTNENQPISIKRGHLTVSDPDNEYPDDFSLKVHSGNNYRFDGNTVTPAEGFSGSLSVNVTVNDGELESDYYALPVEVKPVNRVPQITGQAALQINEDEAIAIQFSHLIVIDGDSNYPEGFSLSLSPGTNYTLTNATVKPSSDFFGMLSVPVTVSDGKNTSPLFNLVITITSVNDIPRVADLETEPLFYGSGELPVAVTESAKVTEVDGDSIMFAEVGFRADSYQSNSDKLIYKPLSNAGIRGVFDATTGILTLLGQASPARYSAALKSVQFQTLAPSSERKVLYILVNDGKSESVEVERLLLSGQAIVSLDIPTGFTPNGDMANDTWKIVPLKTEVEYSNARIRVYNKMGILVYESIGFEGEWDGRMNGELLPADTYYYTIDLNTDTPEGYVKGLVTILR